MRALFILLCCALVACSNSQAPSLAPLPDTAAAEHHIVTKAQVDINSMLWNPGPIYRDGMQSDGSQFRICDIAGASDMSMADYVDSPQLARPIFCGAKQINANGHAPSYQHATYGWTPAQYARYPGWAVWYLSGGYGTPITTRIFNNAATLNDGSDPCQLREVSTSYIGWRDLSNWPGWQNVIAQKNATVFKKSYDINQFATITGTFSARLNRSVPATSCTTIQDSVIENDFAVQHFDINGVLLRTDIGGINVFNASSYRDPIHPEIFWSNNCTQTSPLCIITLNGTELGYPTLNNNFQTYHVEYKSLLAQHFPAPPVGTTTSLVIVFEVYSSHRGNADLEFDLTNMDLIGIPVPTN